MPYNGSGTYTAPANSWNPAVGGTTVDSADWNSTQSDYETAFSSVITRDGQSNPTANLPMAGFKHTGVNPNSGSTSRTEYASGATLQDGAPLDAGDTGGTSTAYTATLTPAIAAYADKQCFRVKFDQPCGAAPDINFNAVGAKKIYKNVSGTATQLAANDIPDNFVAILRYDATLDSGAGGFWLLNEPVSRLIDNSINDFRLTLTSGVPVTTGNVTGATTIYCCPYKGNRIALYGGSGWNLLTSSEFSLALGTLTSGLPYDVFCYNNSGTPTLELLAWTDGTTRATALAYQDGILVKSGDATRRYLGSFYTTSTTATEDSATNRYLWNYYHRVPRKMLRQESTNSWNYTTATWRQANAPAANQISFVIGVSEDEVHASVLGDAVNPNTGGAFASVGIGLDSTSALAADQLNAGSTLDNSRERNLSAHYTGLPGIGRHVLVWLEYSVATGTTTWYGNAGGIRQTGIFGRVMA